MPRSSVQSFDDPEQLRAALRTGDGRYRLLGRGVFGAELTAIELEHVTLQRGRERLARVAYHGMRPRRVGVLGWLGGSGLPVVRGTQMRPQELMSQGLDMEAYHRTSGDIDHVAVTLDPHVLSRTMIEMTGRELAIECGKVLRPSAAALGCLLSTIADATRIASTSPQVFASTAAAHALEQSLLQALIGCLGDGTTRREHAPRVRRAAVMARFEALVEARADEPLHVPELCALLGVPERTLRKCCHEHLGMGPHQYLLRRRMNLARRALLRADPDAGRVTSIAMSHGFWELGRFAGVYRAMYGETPSETLQRSA